MFTDTLLISFGLKSEKYNVAHEIIQYLIY
jgi:hypothetical protein